MVLNGNKMFKMNYVILVYWILIYHGFLGTDGNGISGTESSCEGDWCLNKNDDEVQKNISSEVHSSDADNITENLNSEVYFQLLKSKDDYPLTFLKESTTNDKLYKTVEEINSTYNIEDLFNATDVTVITEISTKDVFSSTTHSPVTKPASTSTTKPNLPTAEINTFLLQNIKKSKKICFCDIEVNHCDINCCCDEDCSLSHFKVFTQCNDNNILYDSKYCYNTNFIFGNNTSHEIIQSNKGLFCIARENLKIDVNYKQRASFTTLDAFNKSLPNKLYLFSYKSPQKVSFKGAAYLAGSSVWSFQNGELTPFKISHSSVGFLCNSEVDIKFLIDEVKSCFYQESPKVKCGNLEIGKVIYSLKDVKIISNPTTLNKSELQNSSKVCQKNSCIGINLYVCQSISNTGDCLKVPVNSKDLPNISCWNSLSHIQYQIWHNGSEGITKMDAYLWVRETPQSPSEFLSQLITEVKYTWIGSTKRIFKRSGNPGYITGKPILAGKKVQNAVNGTTDQKEAIELSLDPKDWLSVLGSNKGICTSKNRIPVNFRENGQYICSLKLSEENFSEEKCVELQNTIFKLLIGNDIINETKEHYFNKFVATFGNSRVEETGDWVQILVDSFPIISSQAFFKSNHNFLICKNIITDLFIDVVYSNTGSFLAPQAKILGVSFQFGKHKDVIYYCDTPGCENSTYQYLKLSSSVSFVDITKPAVDAFAEPLSLEVKLPHDFFYPFFSDASKSKCLSKVVLFLVLILLFL